MALIIIVLILEFSFIYLLSFVIERFDIIKRLEKLILKFSKNIFLKNKKIQLLLENKYIKKLVKFTFEIGKPIGSAIKSYLKVWAETFKLNKNSSSREFIEFVITDLILMLLFSYKSAFSSLVVYNIMALLPRMFLLVRRLKARNLKTNLSFLIFFPIFGWLITWKMGSRNDVITNIEKNEGTNTKKTSGLNFTNFLLSILVIAVLTFGTIYFINENNTSGIKCRGNICKSY